MDESSKADRTHGDLSRGDLGLVHHDNRHALAELRDATAQAANDKVRLFVDVGRVILDPTIADADLRHRIYDLVGAGRLAEAVEEAERLARPADGNYFDLLEARYSQVRQYTPAVLAALRFNSNRSDDQLLAAVELLQELNARGRRAVPDDAPTAFASRRWQPYLHRGDGRVDRHHWELCVLTELRGALRAGNLWLEPSRRYADPTSYLIPPERWDEMRADTAALTGVPLSGEERLAQLGAELDDHLRRLDRALAEAGDRGVRVEDGRLVVPGIDADERPPEVQAAHDQLSGRLPEVDLPDLLVEVDSWCPFLGLFTHAGGATGRTPDLAAHLFAVIVTHACNLRLTDMARISGISYQQLAWAQDWYLRHDTLVAATARIINFHHRLPITAVWGDGTLSSSDGQRFQVGVRTPVARGLPRYFLHRGLTLYTWTSDQHSQFGTKVIAATDREATHVLDAILDNETDLAIAEHTTDTAGYTDLIFGLFDLLGLRYSPRIRDIADTVLWRLGPVDHYPHAGPLLRGRINRERILERWDDLLRVAGSLKHGWVPASLLVARLQASPRQNDLTRAIQEYGRIPKTLSLLRQLHDPD